MRNIFTYFVVLLASISFSQELSQNLLLNYAFDGNSNDLSGNNYNGLPVNINYIQDRFGNENSAAFFNGISSYINFPNLEELKPSLPVSFSFWVKYSSGSYQKQVIFNTSMKENVSSSVVFNSTSLNNKYVINCSDGSDYYAEDTRRSYVSNSSVVPGEWHFIVIIVNAEADMKIYVDCQENGGIYSGSGGNLQYSANPGCLGRHDRSLATDPDYFLGVIDDFSYWGKSLTTEEISSICDGGLSTQLTNKDALDFEIYINQSIGTLSLQSSQQLGNIEIFDALGKKVFSDIGDTEIDISNFESGIFIVKAESAKGFASRKFVKN